jgi:hypothetical protein
MISGKKYNFIPEEKLNSILKQSFKIIQTEEYTKIDFFALKLLPDSKKNNKQIPIRLSIMGNNSEQYWFLVDDNDRVTEHKLILLNEQSHNLGSNKFRDVTYYYRNGQVTPAYNFIGRNGTTGKGRLQINNPIKLNQTTPYVLK